MLSLKPELLVSTATALVSWEYQRKALEAEHDRNSADAKRAEASLRFVHFAGFWSHYGHENHHSSWPLHRSEHIAELTDFAEQHRGRWLTPAAGDVFLLASIRADRHVRAGIIAVVESMGMLLDGCPDFICTTIEGELGAARTDLAAPRVTARFVRRRLSPGFGDAFIRWCDLAPEASPAAVEYEVPRNLVILDRTVRRRAA